MKSAPEIIDLENLVEPYLKGGKIVSYTSKFLTKPGDNYGSIILSITANMKKSDGIIENLSLVAKLPPLLNDFYWNLFEPQRTCQTENAVYEQLAPAVYQLQTNAGIPENSIFDVFAKSFGSRISLNKDSNVVDRDALLVLENLQTCGYRVGNRQKMFDYQHALVILESLAKYHSMPIALRILKPFEFKTKILPYFQRFDMNKNIGKDLGEALVAQTLSEIIQVSNNDELLKAKVKTLIEENSKFMSNPDQCPDGLYTTIAHFDFWINNMMILYDEDGKPSKIKIVDFQLAQYESLAHDIIFFLLTSVDTDVLEKHYDELLLHYYNSLITCLKGVGCPTNEYSFESFVSEVNRIGPIQMPHALFMIKVIYLNENSVPDFENLNPEIFASTDGMEDGFFKKFKDILRLCKKFGFI